MLVKSGLNAADQLGIDVLVVATGRRGQKLYSKHGFEILEEKSQSMSKFGVDELYETFVMIRRAKQRWNSSWAKGIFRALLNRHGHVQLIHRAAMPVIISENLLTKLSIKASQYIPRA